jgi:hypothetical protein
MRDTSSLNDRRAFRDDSGGPSYVSHSWPKPPKPDQRSQAESATMRGRKRLLRDTSRHLATTHATLLDKPGGLEVPSSNLGAPIAQKP